MTERCAQIFNTRHSGPAPSGASRNDVARIASSLSLSSGARSRDPGAPRHDGGSNRIIDASATAASSVEIDANILLYAIKESISQNVSTSERLSFACPRANR
jgi:hypothetical protein